MIEQIITSTVLIMLLLIVSAILEKRISPCIKYALWLLVACKLLIPIPEFETSISVMNVVNRFDEKNIPHATNTQEVASSENSKNVPITGATGEIKKDSTYAITIAEIGKWIWMLGTVVCFGVFLWSNARFRLQLRRHRIFLRNYKDTLAVYEVKGIASPCLFGILKPAIYIPEEIGLTEEQLEYACAHEYTHYKHGDSIWGVVRCVCVILYWYNPAVWIAARKSIRDGELACDAGTIKRIGEQNGIHYGKMLIELAQKESKRSPNLNVLGCSASATGGTSEMKKRIQMIAKRPHTKASAVCVLALASIGMVGCTFGSAEKENTKDLSAIVTTMNDAEDLNGVVAVKQMNTTKGELVVAEDQMQQEMNAVDESQEQERVKDQMNALKELVETEDQMQQEMNAVDESQEQERAEDQMNALEELVAAEEQRQKEMNAVEGNQEQETTVDQMNALEELVAAEEQMQQEVRYDEEYLQEIAGQDEARLEDEVEEIPFENIVVEP